MNKKQLINELKRIPGIGQSIANDLLNIGILSIRDLIGKNPETLYDLSNKFECHVQDRCLLYVFRCAVYYANTPKEMHESEKLKWWYWKDKKLY